MGHLDRKIDSQTHMLKSMMLHVQQKQEHLLMQNQAVIMNLLIETKIFLNFGNIV